MKKEQETTGAKRRDFLKLAGLGSVGEAEGRSADREAFFSFSSWNRPPTVYRLDTATADVSVWREPRVDFPFDSIVVEREFYRMDQEVMNPVTALAIHSRALASTLLVPRQPLKSLEAT